MESKRTSDIADFADGCFSNKMREGLDCSKGDCFIYNLYLDCSKGDCSVFLSRKAHHSQWRPTLALLVELLQGEQ